MGSLNKKAASLVQQLYDRRFNLPGQGEDLPWPLLHGGTFKEVAQRAWADGGSKLLESSLSFLRGVGLLDATVTLEDFTSRHLTLSVGTLVVFLKWRIPKLELLPSFAQEWPPSVGSTFNTHCMMWSMADDSFWKGFVPSSEVLGPALGIARTRMREALWGGVQV